MATPLIRKPATKRFRHTASFGKRQEFVAIAELLRRGLDVYTTLVDDQQIDCIIRAERRGQPRYFDLQIKARSKDAKNPGYFAGMQIRPRQHYWFMFYSEGAQTYWLMPSLAVIHEANRNKSGAHAGKYSLMLARKANSGRVLPRPRFKFWEAENGFQLFISAMKQQ